MGESPQTCLAAANQSISKTGTGARHTCQCSLLGSGLANEDLERVNFLSLVCQANTSQLKGVAGPGSQEAKTQSEEKRGRHRALWIKRLSEGRFSQAGLGGE